MAMASEWSAAPSERAAHIVRVSWRALSTISMPLPGSPTTAVAGTGASVKVMPEMSAPRMPCVLIFGRCW